MVSCKSEYFKNSFVPNEWNKLDLDICSSISYNLFRNALLKFIRPVQINTFSINEAVYNGPSTDGPLSICHVLFLCTFFTYFTIALFSCCTFSRVVSCCTRFISHFFCVALISCLTLSVLHFFIWQSFQVALFSCCTFFVCCTYFAPFLALLHVALTSCWAFLCCTFSCCTFFILHSFQVSLLLCCTLIVLHFSVLHFFNFALFLSSNFFVLYSFRVALFPCCTFFMLRAFHLASFFVLRCFRVVPFVHSFHVALFSCCTLFV